MKIVGEFYPPARLPFSYKKVKKDECGWADSSKFLPLPFDLVYITGTKNTSKGVFNYTGWWTGNKWFSLRLRGGDFVKKWKRPEEGHS